MNLFDKLVNEALKNQPTLSTLRIAVEKEILHHDILRILNQSGLLTDLTFIGGTCLRTCYGGLRLSEDLDFTGGKNFTRHSLSKMGEILTNNLKDKYDLPVKVSEPLKDKKNVDTWKIKIETKPEQKHLPAQRINIDICATPSYDKHPVMLINPYGVDMGTGGLIIQAETREEIYADKLLAFALRPNRLKHRDLWDIVWLHQHGIKAAISLIPNKLKDRKYTIKQFLHIFSERSTLLTSNKILESEFKHEMHRFLPKEQIDKTINSPELWKFISFLISDLYKQLHERLS